MTKNTFRYSLVGESLTHLPPEERVEDKNSFENGLKDRYASDDGDDL